MSKKLFSKIDHITREHSPDKRQIQELHELYDEVVSKIGDLDDTLSTAFTSEQQGEIKKETGYEKKHYVAVKEQLDLYFKKHS